MLEVFALLIFCSAIAYFYSYYFSKINVYNMTHTSTRYKMNYFIPNLLFLVLLIVMVCFAGLRTKMNDTATYISNFNNISPEFLKIFDIDWSIGSNPLFRIYQILLKSLISNSGYVFIFITSLIVVSSFLLFLKKYSINFGYSIFVFISFTVFAFSMAAMKQTLATAIAIWSIPKILEGKKLQPLLLIIIGVLVHPYVIVFATAFFLQKNIWDSKTFILIVAAVLASVFYENFISAVLNVTTTIGEDYELEYFTGNGVSIARFLVYLATPLLSFFYRENIRKQADKMVFLFINLSLISTIFMLIATVGSGIMVGRMANYFDIFQCLALPAILHYGLPKKNEKVFITIVSLLCFCFFYYTYYSKYSGSCFYDHISIIELIKSW